MREQTNLCVTRTSGSAVQAEATRLHSRWTVVSEPSKVPSFSFTIEAEKLTSKQQLQPTELQQLHFLPKNSSSPNKAIAFFLVKYCPTFLHLQSIWPVIEWCAAFVAADTCRPKMKNFVILLLTLSDFPCHFPDQPAAFFH